MQRERMLRALPAAFLAMLVIGCDKVAEPDSPPRPTTSAAPTAADPTELVKEDLTVGTGDRAVKTGDEIKVHYVGRLLKTNATFDSNEGKDKPFEFTVGEGVIEGWSQGVVGMKKGGKRKLTIPSDLAYGDGGRPPKIPGKAALLFEVELVGWQGEADATPTSSAVAGDTSAKAGEPKPEGSAKKGESSAKPAEAATKPVSTALPKALPKP